MPNVRVGGEIDSYCTKCEMVLAHTIIAMVGGNPVKVQCNTCRGVHRYRSDPAAGSNKATKPASPRTARAKPDVTSFDALIQGKDISRARRYAPKETFAVDQVIDHPIFGLGFVSAVKDGRKIEVTFKADVKILVHGKG